MRHAVRRLGFMLALGSAIIASGAGAQDQPIKRTELTRVDLASVEGKEGIAYTAELAPGAEAGRHRHPGDEIIYVLEGSLIIETEGQHPLTLRPGDTHHLAQGLTHNARNASADRPARVLAFLVADKGKPLAEPVK